MGWVWEVEAFVDLDDGRGYRYMQTWTGDGVISAIRAMREVKRNGIGAIRLTWRPA